MKDTVTKFELDSMFGPCARVISGAPRGVIAVASTDNDGKTEGNEFVIIVLQAVTSNDRSKTERIDIVISAQALDHLVVDLEEARQAILSQNNQLLQ